MKIKKKVYPRGSATPIGGRCRIRILLERPGQPNAFELFGDVSNWDVQMNKATIEGWPTGQFAFFEPGPSNMQINLKDVVGHIQNQAAPQKGKRKKK